VTIQPFNTSLPVISKCDSDSKRITFKVEYSGLYNLQKEYVIRSDCLDKYVEGTAKCVGKDSTTDGPTVTFVNCQMKTMVNFPKNTIVDLLLLKKVGLKMENGLDLKKVKA
jgi:hypothetical protein